MKNQAGFVPRSLMQPHYYTKFFGGYAAVYIGNDNKEYLLQIDVNTECDVVNGIYILRQDSDGRKLIILKQFKTIKSATENLRAYMFQNNLI